MTSSLKFPISLTFLYKKSMYIILIICLKTAFWNCKLVVVKLSKDFHVFFVFWNALFYFHFLFRLKDSQWFIDKSSCYIVLLKKHKKGLSHASNYFEVLEVAHNYFKYVCFLVLLFFNLHKRSFTCIYFKTFDISEVVKTFC